MNKNVVLIILGAVFASVIVALVVQSGMKKDDSGTAAPIDMTRILVANKHIAIGKRLSEEDTEWKKWPKDGVFTGAIEKDPEKEDQDIDVYGQIVRRVIEKGEPVTQNAILEESQSGSFVAASLEENMRAYSIRVRAESSVGGLVRPGDFVDVIVTYGIRLRGEIEDAAEGTVLRDASQTVLENIRVLAVDQRTEEKADSDKASKPGKTVTLEVTREGAEVLALADKMGDLSLALRKLGDTTLASPEEKQKLITDVGISNLAQELVKIWQRQSVQTGTIRVYNGRDVRDVPVRTGP
ncbi:MAG: Flp pilus assembly protein CpaB [Pseudomonadota bacterium]|nr:Flp pilus assembly protein CpaB [Pseudomonadota bacterium]QKK05022.1 MAG: Flp pilus assembly protein CpaB [Pseudomonadota bacterium]